MTDGPRHPDERHWGVALPADDDAAMRPPPDGTDRSDPSGGAGPPLRGPFGPSPGTLVLATDLTAASGAATACALALAGRLTIRLLIVHVLDRGRLYGVGSHARIDQARAEREALLVELVERAARSRVHAEFLVWQGDAGASIVAAAEAEAAEFVVVGTRARGSAERLVLGSVSDHVVRHAPCPVLVVRPTDVPVPRRSGSQLVLGRGEEIDDAPA